MLTFVQQNIEFISILNGMRLKQKNIVAICLKNNGKLHNAASNNNGETSHG